MKPSIGRIVHYYRDDCTENSKPEAAIIAYVDDETNTVNLTVFAISGESYGETNVPRKTQECYWGWERPPTVV